MMRMRTLGLIAAAAVGLAGCTDGYGYSGLDVGYGAFGYADGFGGGYYDDYAHTTAFTSPYWGWQGDYYYPGNGDYVYDRYQRPFRWNDSQRNYWQGRQNGWRGDRREIRENWQDFRQERRRDERAFRQDRREDREAFRQGAVTRDQFRAERRDDRRAYNRDYRQDRRALRRENRRDWRD
jgi:hypothetical protein